MQAHILSGFPRWLGAVTSLGAVLLLGQSLAVWLGGEPVLPALLSWVLGGCAMLGPVWALGRGAPLERVLSLFSLVGFVAHLLLLGPALLALQPGEEMRSLFAGELGRVVAGFPVQATIALVCLLSWGGLLLRLLPPHRSSFLVTAVCAGIGTILILSYATGGLLPFIP